MNLLQPSLIAHYLPPRQATANKADFGHVLVIGGNDGFIGAAQLAAMAGLRVGAGLVSLATRQTHAALANHCQAEIMAHAVESESALSALLCKATVVVLGPGLGQDQWAQTMWQCIYASQLPLVVDADGLNLLANHAKRRNNWVLTPHPGEAGRLLGQSSAQIQAARQPAALALQQKYAGVVVLKGAGTIIQGQQSWQCAYGNPGMASGGMGDVLSGVIAGLVAQGIALEAAAQLGVLLHALAGDRAAQAGGQRGLLASDLLPYLRQLVNP